GGSTICSVRGARWEDVLAPLNARSLFGRLFLARRFLFAYEAGFPVFSLGSARGHGSALFVRFGLFTTFLFPFESHFPVFSFCSRLGGTVPLWTSDLFFSPVFCSPVKPTFRSSVSARLLGTGVSCACATEPKNIESIKIPRKRFIHDLPSLMVFV